MRDHACVEARRTELGWDLVPERAALLVRGDRHPFALVGAWAGGGALIGSEPVRVAGAGDDPFALLDELPPVGGDLPQGAGGVGGGWFGWLGYRLGRRVERLDTGPPRPAPLPDFQLAYYDHLVRLDADGQWWFECLWTPERADALAAREAELRARVAEPRPFATDPWSSVPGSSGHELAVDAARERIHAGDLFQANVCLRLESRLEGDPLDLFAAGVEALTPDRAAFVGGSEGVAVASLSPELFLERRGRRVRSAPIKGTRPRSDDPAELEASAKDRAENTMIVDLMRNDLGRVCRPGSVTVDALTRARAHAGVWHLVSEVSGELREGAGDADLLRACFPPGSVTGAPKIAAQNVIAELESTGREAYTGAIGFASPVAGLELSVAIRTFEFAGADVWLGVGGGVVADSNPAAEARECAVKAEPLLRAIGAAHADPRGFAPHSEANPRKIARRGPQPTPRPDPEAGVFSTLMIRDGLAVAADAHVARLGASVAELYGARLPADMAEQIENAADAHAGPGRMRVTYVPGNADPAAIVVSPTKPGGRPPTLAPVTLPGGIGAHKWIDRRLLDELKEEAAPALPLLVDLDGYVLESWGANVFARISGGTLVTPPLDGRILPGVGRARLLAEHEDAREQRLTLDALLGADEVLLTSALGVQVAATAPEATSANTSTPNPTR